MARRKEAAKPQSRIGMSAPPAVIEKCPTGILGLDEITLGGFPRGRPTLVCGGAGTGKTLMGLQFIARGAATYNEPGVCVSFEENTDDLQRNAASLGFDLASLIKQNKIAIDYVLVDRSEILESGEYDLEALFLRLASEIDRIKAKRVFIDTVEALFAGLSDEGTLRAEISRLMRWLKDRGVTAVITSERGEGSLTRHGLEEYISDCVVLLEQRVDDGVVTRRLRVVKYRGSTHGTNEYPFLIDRDGVSVLPVTSVELEHIAVTDRISTGVAGLDEMLGGKGYFRGCSILVSGTAGTGKTSLAASLVNAACARGQKSLFFAFEESRSQLMRNMRSIGLDLEPWEKKGLLHFHTVRPTMYGLEMHLVSVHRLVQELKPDVVVVDPLSSLTAGASQRDLRGMLLRMVDYLKQTGTTAFFTALTGGGKPIEETELDVSSLVDTWLLLRDLESAGERNKVIYVLKSRGMSHSNQVREFLLTDSGVQLRDPYIGPGGVLTGSARLSQEAREREAEYLRRQDTERKRHTVERRRRLWAAQIAALEAKVRAEEDELQALESSEQLVTQRVEQQREAMARSRHVPLAEGAQNGSNKRGGRK